MIFQNYIDSLDLPKFFITDTLLGVTPLHLLGGILVYAFLDVILHVFVKQICTRLAKIAAKTDTLLDDTVIYIINSVHPRTYNLVALYFALLLCFDFSDPMQTRFHQIIVTVVALQCAVSIKPLIKYFATKLVRKDKTTQIDAEIQTLIDGAALFLYIVFWTIMILFLLSNFGINIATLVTSLGIGGIAVALAVQNILSDILSSFTIYFDKPFTVGDFIIVGDTVGVVKKIGIRTTRIQSLQGEEIIYGNKALTSSIIQNFKKMDERRITFSLGITYETSPEKLKMIPDIIKSIFANYQDYVRLDRVNFKEFADFSLNYEIVYYHKTSDYAEYMQIREQVNLEIKEVFDANSIDFAYPTQLVYHQNNTHGNG